ncbi:GTPase Era, partial [Actinomyces slackii]|uniref:GTPase Era n=1 Tax=Actinomyces slackii TaxID=52774 RepID=UPI0039E8FBF3
PPPIRFPSDAELMDGPNALEDEDWEDGEDGEDRENRENSPGSAEGGLASARVSVQIPDYPEDFRAGFACFVGRPNAGKSTLTNALVGTKVAITSGRPQTTRHNVRGVVHRPTAQLVLVDTPGLHRPKTLLGKRLNDLVRQTLADVDVVAMCIPADEKVGPGDRFIARDLADLRTPVVAVVTKADTVSREALAAQLLAVDALGDWADIVPVSAKSGEQIDVLEEVFVGHLPLSPPLYPTGEITDEPQEVMIAELVREAALEGVRDELPHSLAVVVDEIADPRDTSREAGLVKGTGQRLQVRVSLVVERDSQKAIVIGRSGARLKEVGVRARQGIERLLGRKVYLDLHVRTAKDWQSDPKALARLGF